MTVSAHPLFQAKFDRPPANNVPVIRDDAEALKVAAEVARFLAEDEAARDRDRLLPVDEIDRLSDTGICAIVVPREYGGAGVSFVTLAEVVERIAGSDPSVAQAILMNFALAVQFRLSGTPEQRRFVFERLLKGYRFANATTEIGVKQSNIFLTRIAQHGDGYRVTGKKFYTTGSLLSHFVSVAGLADDGRVAHAIVRRTDPGVTILDDWDGFGQRTTASGTMILDDVDVPAVQVLLPDQQHQTGPYGSVGQIIHAAIDAGIARAALAETIAYVRQHTRPWRYTGLEHGYDDPYIIAGIGELTARLHGAEALLERAGRAVDLAIEEPTPENAAAAAVVVGEAKLLTTEIALAVTTKLFQYVGARAVTGKFALDRFWRNARAHTAHDPLHWKAHLVGNYHLNGRAPQRDGSV